MHVDAERLRADIEQNATFGAIEPDRGRGRTVLVGSEANRQARDHLVDRLEAANLEVTIDAVGNILGIWTPSSAANTADPVVAGSHLDSVPGGGIFDGPLGVYAALEAVRAMQAAKVEPHRPVGVVSFTEEEGSRFGGGLLGSSVATGITPADEALAREDADGITLDAALKRIEYRGEGSIDAGDWHAFCELHVEQDTALEAGGYGVGIVSAITGICHVEVRIEGEANHAGATPMGERTDALAAAAEIVLAVEEMANDIVASSSETAVGTVGKCTVSPNATNVVPGRVDLGVDIRDIGRDTMDDQLTELEDIADEIAANRGVEMTIRRSVDVDPESMSDRVMSAFSAAADRRDIAALELPSGAAHDTMNIARVTDAGLLFAPSRDGISHSPLEWTDWEDCATATQVLADALVELVTQ